VSLLQGLVAPMDVLAETLDLGLPVVQEDGYVRADPWACPSDRELYPVLGFSYRYTPLDFMAVLGDAARQQATQLFLSNPDAVLLTDSAPFHDGARNVVRTSGVAERADDRGLLPGVR
jgi:hypothetical protein